MGKKRKVIKKKITKKKTSKKKVTKKTAKKSTKKKSRAAKKTKAPRKAVITSAPKTEGHLPHHIDGHNEPTDNPISELSDNTPEHDLKKQGTDETDDFGAEDDDET